MTDDIKVIQIENPLECYFAEMSISDEVRAKYNRTDFLILPDKTEEHGYVFQSESIDFIKYCRLSDGNYTYDIITNSEPNIHTLSFHSIDILMPIIYVAGPLMLQVAVNLISNYIWDKIKGREDKEHNIQLTIIVNEGERSIKIRYEGDAKTFSEKFADINFDKL